MTLDLTNIPCFGIAGNFTGHLEQAGEAGDFRNIKTKEESAPKAVFPTYIPGAKSPVPDAARRMPKAFLISCRKRTEKLFVRICNLLNRFGLSVHIPCRKYFKKIHLRDGNPIFFTIFAVPKIGFLSFKWLIFRVFVN